MIQENIIDDHKMPPLAAHGPDILAFRHAHNEATLCNPVVKICVESLDGQIVLKRLPHTHLSFRIHRANMKHTLCLKSIGEAGKLAAITSSP